MRLTAPIRNRVAGNHWNHNWRNRIIKNKAKNLFFSFPKLVFVLKRVSKKCYYFCEKWHPKQFCFWKIGFRKLGFQTLAKNRKRFVSIIWIKQDQVSKQANFSNTHYLVVDNQWKHTYAGVNENFKTALPVFENTFRYFFLLKGVLDKQAHRNERWRFFGPRCNEPYFLITCFCKCVFCDVFKQLF